MASPAPDVSAAEESAGWLEQRQANDVAESISAISFTDNVVSRHSFMKMQVAELHASPVHAPRLDRDLTAELIATQRLGLDEETEQWDEDWWMTPTGVVIALITGFLMYTRTPHTRKRKYRRTPHEPYGPYRKRG